MRKFKEDNCFLFHTNEVQRPTIWDWYWTPQSSGTQYIFILLLHFDFNMWHPSVIQNDGLSSSQHVPIPLQEGERR
jgi:hypothetical protein